MPHLSPQMWALAPMMFFLSLLAIVSVFTLKEHMLLKQNKEAFSKMPSLTWKWDL